MLFVKGSNDMLVCKDKNEKGILRIRDDGVEWKQKEKSRMAVAEVREKVPTFSASFRRVVRMDKTFNHPLNNNKTHSGQVSGNFAFVFLRFLELFFAGFFWKCSLWW